MKRRKIFRASILGLSTIIGGFLFLGIHSVSPAQASGTGGNQVFVGGDLHSLTALGNQLFVTGHQGAGVSSDGGVSWSPVPSLTDADVMGWSKTSTALLVGGHPGLYRSTDGGSTFTKIDFYKDISDVHSIGASGNTVYLGSPQIGLLKSTDGGKKWLLRNAEIGQGFMGSMLVDPTNSDRVIAPDMQTGVVTSNDGGLTWQSLGGPMGTMSVAWNPKNIEHIAVIGMDSNALSKDAGSSWQDLTLPKGSSAIAYSEDGKKLYVAVLDGDNARVFTSADNGKTWNSPVAQTESKNGSATMDPNMPGMDHSGTATGTASAQRPIALTLGIFGLVILAVLLAAIIIRRKDRLRNLRKKMARVGSTEKK